MSDYWLTGWKAIAKYLGVCERTAMRYSDNDGMPVKRLPSGKPTALGYELDRWRAKYAGKLNDNAVGLSETMKKALRLLWIILEMAIAEPVKLFTENKLTVL